VDLIHPHTADEVTQVLGAASRRGVAVLIVGGRTHMDEGNPTEVDVELWTTLLDRVVAYDPAEMLVVAEAGVRMRDLRALLAEGGQEWPVDTSDEATVGGTVAAGAVAMRQLRVGAMRDTVVEMELVTGDGRAVRSGARTVKNVTGFDVHRLVTGSLGTLGCITQVALKVRPLPKAAITLVADEGGLPLGEHLLGAVALPAALLAEPDRLWLRLEGWPEEVREQVAAARSVVRMAEDASPFPPPSFPEAPILARAAVAPSRLRALLEGVQAYRALLGVGYAWVPLADPEDLRRLRTAAVGLGGVAPVERGSGGLGDASLAGREVHGRVRAALDPQGILAPGRGWA
jgi:glycolate oxidase FAD binding subunit